MPNTNLRTDQYIKGSKKITKDMAGESKYFQMAPTIKVSGEMILLMAEAFSCNLMEANMLWEDGRLYEGMWKNGEFNGHGKYYTNNFFYEGNFKDGKPHLQGIYTWSDGRYYDG